MKNMRKTIQSFVAHVEKKCQQDGMLHIVQIAKNN